METELDITTWSFAPPEVSTILNRTLLLHSRSWASYARRFLCTGQRRQWAERMRPPSLT